MEIENDNHQKQSLPVTGDSVRTDSEQTEENAEVSNHWTVFFVS